MCDYMERALQLAEMALAVHEVPVGCVFVVDDKIVAESQNQVNRFHNATRHAELNCIDTVMEYCKDNFINYKEYFPEISVFVTVEPCIMCASALHQLKVKEVTYGCTNDRFGGKTVVDVAKIYEDTYSYKLMGNVRADEAMSLLKQFYKGINPSAPPLKQKKKDSA